MTHHAAITRYTPQLPIPERVAVSWLEHDIHVAVRSAAPILLTGDSHATRALAYRLHSSSGWRYGPFLLIDCGSPDASLETSWFKALFPSGPPAGGKRPLLQLAQSGTVLLQEIGRLSRPVQESLADRLVEVTRSRRPGQSYRRVIASTSEPLLARVENGTFDDRLFYRLNVIHFRA